LSATSIFIVPFEKVGPGMVNATRRLVERDRFQQQMKYRDVIRVIERDGWAHVRTTGSHLPYRHPTKPGTVTISAGG
jgi:hypothetical protein